MGLYSTLSQTGTGSTSWYPVNYNQSNFKIGLGVVVSGTVTYTIQHTFDDVYDPSVTPVAFDHDTLATLSANADGNYAYPIRAIRVTVSAGTGTAALTIIQGD